MPTGPDRPLPRNETGPGGNDMPPSGEEARAQRKATSLPLVWLVLGLLVILAFAALLTASPPFVRSFKGRPAPPASALAAPPQRQTTN